MKDLWNRFKHWVGLHDPKTAEWLDGRTFVDGSNLRTYYCQSCKVVFHRGNTTHEPRQMRMSYEQLKAERDAEMDKWHTLRKMLEQCN